MKSATLLSVLFVGSALAAGHQPGKRSTTCKSKSTTAKTTRCTSTTSTSTSTSTPCSTSTTTSNGPPSKPGCNADSCARAVTGTNQGLATQSAHEKDCSSFFICTAYPSMSTITATATVYDTYTTTSFAATSTSESTYTTIVTTALTETLTDTIPLTTSTTLTVTAPEVTETVTVAPPADKRNAISTSTNGFASVICPTAVPTYASACSGTARFSSACSCWGVTTTTSATTTPITTTTITVTGQTTVTQSGTTTLTQSVAATSSVTFSTTDLTSLVEATDTISTTTTSTTVVTVQPPAPSANAYCENGQPVNGMSSPCTAVGCSTTNLRIEGSSDTIYEGIILAGPRNITTASGGTHLCDGTNNGANPTPFNNFLTAVDAASQLCGFAYDGQFITGADDFDIQIISDTEAGASEFWGILLNLNYPPEGGCETEVHPTDEALWAFNAFGANYFLRVEPTNTPVTLSPGQSTTFTVQGADGSGDPFVNIAGASFNGQTSNGAGVVAYTAPTTPGTYRYKASRSDSIRSNAVTVIVTG